MEVSNGLVEGEGAGIDRTKTGSEREDRRDGGEGTTHEQGRGRRSRTETILRRGIDVSRRFFSVPRGDPPEISYPRRVMEFSRSIGCRDVTGIDVAHLPVETWPRRSPVPTCPAEGLCPSPCPPRAMSVLSHLSIEHRSPPRDILVISTGRLREGTGCSDGGKGCSLDRDVSTNQGPLRSSTRVRGAGPTGAKPRGCVV